MIDGVCMMTRRGEVRSKPKSW